MAEAEVQAITKDTLIGDLVRIDSNVIPLLMNIGMHCIGCPASLMETIEEAAYVHGIDPDQLVKELNNIVVQDQAQAPDKQ